MNDIRNQLSPCNNRRDNVCIDTMRVLDSCRDKDCFEDTKVFLTDFGQEIIEKCGSLRVKNTKVICCNINADPVQFNRGFYSVTVRLYTKLTLEACVCMGKPQEIEGIAVNEKKVVLYGSEGNVSVFSTDLANDCFCTVRNDFNSETNGPTVVVEVVDPVALGVKIKENCSCCPCCCAEEIPQAVLDCLCGNVCSYSPSGKNLYVSLGFFSVIRIERPGQFLISGSEYCVPDKECVVCDNQDPCAVFAKMAFPVGEFCPSAYPDGCSCDCKK